MTVIIIMNGVAFIKALCSKHDTKIFHLSCHLTDSMQEATKVG